MGLTELNKGKIILFQDELYIVTDYAHSKRGRGGAVAQTKLKNLKTNKTLSKNFTEADRFEIAYLEGRTLQFLYREGANWIFMDQESFDQMTLPEELLGEAAQFLKANAEVTGSVHNGPPLRVVRGDTVSNTLKPATLETGAEIRVPRFINKGDRLKVDTRDGRYVERL